VFISKRAGVQNLEAMANRFSREVIKMILIFTTDTMNTRRVRKIGKDSPEDDLPSIDR
jgi:hypothetical protein